MGPDRPARTVSGRDEHHWSEDEAARKRWSATRRYRADAFEIATLARRKAGLGLEVTVMIPVKECAETIAGVLEVTVGPLRAAGLVDEIVVVDAASADGSAAIAAAAGALVLQQDQLCSALGPALGKGDAMWRALQACGGEIVCFLDGDTGDPSVEHLLGLIGPLLTVPELVMVRGSFERAFAGPEGRVEHEGGRVTELMARPLINLYEPLLAGFGQPLAGEFSARRDALEALAFPVGYGVEIATLIDTVRAHGLDAVGECQLGSRQNRHQPLRALGEMAYSVLAAVERRRGPHPTGRLPTGEYLRPWSGDQVTVAVAERPPIRDRRAREHEDERAASSG